MDFSGIPSGTIVVGVDGSPSSVKALAWAVEQASFEHRPIVLLHGISLEISDWASEPVSSSGLIREALLSEGRDLVARAHDFVRREAPGLEVHEAVQTVDPRHALLTLSQRAAMVVLGSRGRGQLKSMLLGSVSLEVSRHAACPVVIVRLHDSVAAGGGIVVGVDGTEGAVAALEFAYRQASLRSQPLRIFHGFVDPPLGYRGIAPLIDGANDTDERMLVFSESVAGMTEKYPDVAATFIQGHGFAHQYLVEASEGMDLVVVGTHPTNPVRDAFFGESGRVIVEHAHCAVVVVPDAL